MDHRIQGADFGRVSHDSVLFDLRERREDDWSAERMRPMRELSSRFGTLKLLDGNIAIAEPREGTNITPQTGKDVIAAIEEHYAGRYGFIANDVSSYSLEPEVFQFFSERPNLVGVAIVAYREVTEKLYHTFEKKVIKKPSEVFRDLELAKAWLTRLIESQGQDD